MQYIQLIEYQTQSFPAETFSSDEIQTLWENHRPVLHIDPPSFQNDFCWVMTPQGWVGHIPLSAEKTIVIQPKVPVQNLFGMLKQVYRLPSFKFIDGLTRVETLEGMLDLLAFELASRVHDRLRQGIFQTYLKKREPISVVRGRVDSRWLATHPADSQIQCDFTEQTADVPFNQVLAYTLRLIAVGGACSKETMRIVNKAWRQMPVTMLTFQSIDLADWGYSRLNADYRPMHALCRLFLDVLQPKHQPDQIGHHMLPFLVNMPVLYEKYVASWLGQNLPAGYSLREQERVDLDTNESRYVDLDLIIFDAVNNPVIVLDTKYKAGEPTNDDIYQVTFYAREIGCRSAGLVYPIRPNTPLSGRNQEITYRAYTFALDHNSNEAGAAFLKQLDL
ncbi:MAG: restriction endonuclease [Chloroflexota bacterium]